MYLAVFSSVIVCHLYVCAGYSPVPSLPTLGDIYYTTSDLQIQVAETWAEYKKLLSIYNNYNTSIHKLYAESVLAEKKCAIKIQNLYEQVKNENNLIELIKKETDYLNRTFSQNVIIKNSDAQILQLQSALMVEEVIHSSLKSKIEEIKTRQLLQQRSLLDNDGIASKDYETLYSQFLSLLEYNHYLRKELVRLEIIEKDYKAALTKNDIECEKKYAELLQEYSEKQGIEKKLSENLNLLNKFMVQIKDRKNMDSISLINKLNELKSKNIVLKNKLSHLNKQTLNDRVQVNKQLREKSQQES